MIKCRRCKKQKSELAFSFKHKKLGIRNTECKACHTIYFKAYYRANKTAQYARVKVNKQRYLEENRQHIVDYLSVHPCVDCGNVDIRVLEFDHLSDKEFHVCGALHSYSWKTIQAEIQKCDVVCANCHRIRTTNRGNWWRKDLVPRQDGENG